MMTLMELYALAEHDHIEVDAFELDSREALSVMDSEGDCFIAIDPFQLRSNFEEKTKLGHELGHCEEGAFYNQYSPYDLRARHEHRADKWAILHLIPEDELNDLVRQGRTALWELAEWFGVTEDLMRKAVDFYQTGTFCA